MASRRESRSVKPEVSKTNRFLTQIVTDWYLTRADTLNLRLARTALPSPRRPENACTTGPL